jgi:hypothetical protein
VQRFFFDKSKVDKKKAARHAPAKTIIIIPSPIASIMKQLQLPPPPTTELAPCYLALGPAPCMRRRLLFVLFDGSSS